MRAQSFSHVHIFMTPWTVAHQAPLSVEFSRQEGVFLAQGLNLRLLRLFHWQADSSPLCHRGSTSGFNTYLQMYCHSPFKPWSLIPLPLNMARLSDCPLWKIMWQKGCYVASEDELLQTELRSFLLSLGSLTWGGSQVPCCKDTQPAPCIEICTGMN